MKTGPQSCPRCTGGFTSIDEQDGGNICINCGWRLPVTAKGDVADQVERFGGMKVVEKRNSSPSHTTGGKKQ